MLPVMNIMFLLIPALLLSMEVASLAAITVTPPQFTISPDKDPSDPPKPATSLRIRVVEDGFEIELKGARDADSPDPGQAGPSIPLARASTGKHDPSAWDYAALEARVDQLRPLLEEGSSLEISAEPQIVMQVLVNTIDAAQDREHPLPLLVSSVY